MKIIQVSLLLVTLWSGIFPALAQPRFSYPVASAGITSTIAYRSWKLTRDGSEVSASQVVFPVTILRPLRENVDLFFSTSNAKATTQSDKKYTLNGLTDGKIKLNWRLAENTLLLSAGANLPFGKNAFSEDEFLVANYLVETILGFPARRYGEGADVDLGGVYARNFKEHCTWGVGLGYLHKGAYAYQKDVDSQFKPGDEFSAHFGLDTALDSIFIRTDILYRKYGSDKLDDEEFLTQGDQIEFEGAFQYRAHPFLFAIALHDVVKQKNSVAGVLGQALLGGRNFIGNSFFSQVRFVYDLNPRSALGGSFGFNQFGESDLQLADAWTLNAGVEIYLKFAEAVITQLELSYLTGEAESGTVLLNGLHTGCGISIRL